MFEMIAIVCGLISPEFPKDKDGCTLLNSGAVFETEEVCKSQVPTGLVSLLQFLVIKGEPDYKVQGIGCVKKKGELT